MANKQQPKRRRRPLHESFNIHVRPAVPLHLSPATTSPPVCPTALLLHPATGSMFTIMFGHPHMYGSRMSTGSCLSNCKVLNVLFGGEYVSKPTCCLIFGFGISSKTHLASALACLMGLFGSWRLGHALAIACRVWVGPFEIGGLILKAWLVHEVYQICSL